MGLLEKLISLPRFVIFKVFKSHNRTGDMDAEFWSHNEKLRGYTLTSVERRFALFEALKYVHNNKIEGDFVECGVYRGGSSLLAALVLSDLGDQRDLWLYDTFAGMTPPTQHDFKKGSDLGKTQKAFEQRQHDDHNEWCYASLEDVKACLALADYPDGRIHYVVGDVLKTIPETAPEKIAILRLDTDFYDSTKHEMIHLYDRLVPGGILILDDYGDWQGARKAVDEYFAGHPNPPFLARIDDTGRIAQKPR